MTAYAFDVIDVSISHVGDRSMARRSTGLTSTHVLLANSQTGPFRS